MEEKAVRGVLWTILRFSSSRAIGLLTTVVLARLLVPSDFGLVAIGLIVVSFFTLFADFGLGHTLVLRQDLDARAQGTILTLMILLGVTVAGVAVALAPLLADAFQQPEATSVISALAVVLSFVGVSSFYDQVMRRKLEFRRQFTASMIQSVIYATTAITLAAVGLGVWSLVIGQGVGMAALCAAFVTLAPYRVKPAFDRGAARAAVGEGKGFLLQAGAGFFGKNSDNIAVGGVLGASALGVYANAYRISEVSYQAVTNPVALVTFPGFTRMIHRGENVRPAYLSILKLVALVACPIGILLSAVADPFVQLVFGDKWLAMIGPLAVLGVWAAIRPLMNQTAWLLNAFRQQMMIALTQALVLLVTIPALFVAASLAGITAVAYVLLARVVVMLSITSRLAATRAGVGTLEQWRAVRAIVFACPLTWLAARGVVEAGDEALGTAGALALALAAGLGVYAAVVSVLEPGTLGTARDQLRRILSRSSGDGAAGPRPRVEVSANTGVRP